MPFSNRADLIKIDERRNEFDTVRSATGTILASLCNAPTSRLDDCAHKDTYKPALCIKRTFNTSLGQWIDLSMKPSYKYL